MKHRLEHLMDRVDDFWDVDGWPSRILLLLVLLAWGGGLTLGGLSVPADRAAAAGVWVAVVLLSVTAQAYRHRHGGLIVSRHEDGTADPETNRSGGFVWFYPGLLLAVGAGLAGGAGLSALYAAVGAIILSYTPLPTYSGFVQRSAAHRGEDI